MKIILDLLAVSIVVTLLFQLPQRTQFAPLVKQKRYIPRKKDIKKKITDNPVTKHKKKITDRFSQQKTRAKDTEKNIIEEKKQTWEKIIIPYIQEYKNGQLSSDECIKNMENEYITLIKKQANKE